MRSPWIAKMVWCRDDQEALNKALGIPNVRGGRLISAVRSDGDGHTPGWRPFFEVEEGGP